MSGAEPQDRLWPMIADGRDGILATINPDGGPQLSNIYYLADATSSSRLIRFSTTTDRRKGRNLLRDPRAAIHVSGRNFLSYAVAEGSVSVAIPQDPDDPHDPAVEELFEIHSALGAVDDRAGFGRQMISDHRMAVRLTVDRVYGQIVDREPRPRPPRG